jgi:voltage-gated potassium channel
VEKNAADTIIGIITNQPVEFFEEIESKFPSLQLRFVRGEPTSEDVLRRAATQSADQVIILADQALSDQSADDRSIIIANAIHFISRKVNVTVQLMKSSNKNLLHRIGIESIIVYDELGGYLLANTLIEQRYLELYERLAKDHEQKMSIIKIPEDLIGKSYGETFDHLYKEHQLLVIGIFAKEPDLDINDIFTDDSSAIDQFIKSALAKSHKATQEKKTSISWNPPRNTTIDANDMAIVMS